MTVADYFNVHTTLVHIPLGRGGYDLSWIEAVGTAFCLPCIWLASRERIENFPFGVVNASCFAVIFFQIQLYASLLLQIYFVAANIYGWCCWGRGASQASDSLHVRWMLARPRAIAGMTCAAAIAIMTWRIDALFREISAMMVHLGAPSPGAIPSDPYPFWDSAILVLQVAAMILMARKFVESWILWTFTYALGTIIYFEQGVLVMALENIVLTMISLGGLMNWMAAAKSSAMPAEALPKVVI
jgi:nicotinamide mononucleotide transporter